MLALLKKFGDNKKFNGLEELKNQLEKDKHFANNENYLSSEII